MTKIVHLADGTERRWIARRPIDGGEADSVLPVSLGDLLAMPLAEARTVIDAAPEGAPPEDAAGGGVAQADAAGKGVAQADAAGGGVAGGGAAHEGAAASESRLLAPVDVQEVWAAGVTYRRSRDGRAEESSHTSFYDAVYDADRPELFFKSTPARVVGHGDLVGIRSDSGWDVPEPEIGLVVNAHGELFGFVPGNDMSSRSIEGENPLYLPQAKSYERSCALGPWIVPAWEVDEPLTIALRISRGGDAVYEAETSSSEMKRTFPDLIDWLGRAMDFPSGVVLLTGTGIVPPRDFTLAAGDIIDVRIDGVGTLTNEVTVVGR